MMLMLLPYTILALRLTTLLRRSRIIAASAAINVAIAATLTLIRCWR